MSRLEHIKELIEKGDNDPFLLFALAKEMEKIDINKAIELFEKLKLLDPEYVGLYYHLGKCYEKIGKFDEAKNIYNGGVKYAKRLADFHAASELNSALQMLEDENL